MEKLPKVKHELSAAEKMMIVRSHHYFMKVKDEGRSGTQRKVRQRVVECMGICQSTVECVIAQWNHQGDPGFPAEPSPRGKPPLCYSASLVTTIRDTVYERNQKVLPRSGVEREKVPNSSIWVGTWKKMLTYKEKYRNIDDEEAIVSIYDDDLKNFSEDK